jgi:hypothetical protein
MVGKQFGTLPSHVGQKWWCDLIRLGTFALDNNRTARR